MRLLTFLESVETDRATAAHARRVADAIQDYLNLHESPAWGMRVVGREGGIPTMLMQGVEKMLRTLDWDEDELDTVKDLVLLFIPKGTYKHLSGGYGKWEGKPIIIMEVLNPDAPPKYVNTRFSTVKKVFMHEFTHHLDSLRTQGKSMGVAGRWKPEEIQHDLTDYFSNPKEFNAYFTEVIEELDATFNRVIPQIEKANPDGARYIAKRILGNSFPEFVENVRTQVFGEEYVLTPVYRKKFVRRLYKHYVDIMAALREKGLAESFRDETTIPNVDDILDDPEYFRRAKKKQARRVQMSPREYIERAIKGFQRYYDDRSPDEVRKMVLGSRSKSKAEEYAKAMQAGDKFPALSLDYSSGFSQEGLHRAIAAMMIGLETVPVVIVEPA